jgi:hypothetical protein
LVRLEMLSNWPDGTCSPVRARTPTSKESQQEVCNGPPSTFPSDTGIFASLRIRKLA